MERKIILRIVNILKMPIKIILFIFPISLTIFSAVISGIILWTVEIETMNGFEYFYWLINKNKIIEFIISSNNIGNYTLLGGLVHTVDPFIFKCLIIIFSGSVGLFLLTFLLGIIF